MWGEMHTNVGFKYTHVVSLQVSSSDPVEHNLQGRGDQEQELANLRVGLARVRHHEDRLQQIYSALEEDRPAKRVKMLPTGQEEVKEQLEEQHDTLTDVLGGEAEGGRCSYCRVPLSSYRSR